MPHRINFKAIKDAASFERVLAYYDIEHRGRSDQRKALCPFHNDTKPSLNVNLTKKVFNCYPCGDGGDIIKFVAKKEYPADPDGHRIEAAEKLAEICGIPLDHGRVGASHKPAEKTDDAPEQTTVESPAPAPTSSAEPEQSQTAPDNPPLTFQLKVDPTHPYLAVRGLSPEAVETFGLGYCVSEKSIMRQRILIPIHNERGELVAYAGRWPADSGWPEGTDKYTLPPKFHKLRVLFNLNRVIPGMRDGQWPGHDHHIVLVEGFFGAFAVHPFAPCAALMGSALSDDHLELLNQAGIRFVTLVLDGPSRGFSADQHRLWVDRSTVIVRNLAAHGIFVRARELADGEQPDTISRERLASLVSF